MKKRILIVDDDQEMLILFAKKLQQAYDVITAINGVEALDKALTKAPNLIILDLLLPDISGHEICQKLKEDKQTENIPILFLTGHNNPNDVVESFEQGVENYITKPISPKQLSHYIEEALST